MDKETIERIEKLIGEGAKEELATSILNIIDVLEADGFEPIDVVDYLRHKVEEYYEI